MSAHRYNLFALDLDAVDRIAARRHYRILRCVAYDPRGDKRLQVSHGHSRRSAREWVWNHYCELAWHLYLGEK